MATFKLLKTLPELTRSGHAGCVFNNRMVISGGALSSNALNDVWQSVDGINWDRLCTGANSFSARKYHKMVVHDNCLYVVAGEDTANNDLADVWMSRDGTKWDCVTANGGFGAREGFSLWSFGGYLYLAGGFGNSVYMTDMWRSRDGVSWDRVNTGYSRNNRYLAGNVVYDGKMWSLGGAESLTLTDDSMWTIDGQEWREGDMSADFGPLYAMGAEVFDNKMVIVSGNPYDRDSGDYLSRQLWYSYTGTEWYLGCSDVGFAYQHFVMLALKNPNRLFVLFGSNVATQSDKVWVTEGVEFKDNMIG